MHEQKSPESSPINRRELLKALGAAGGALAAAAFLPGKWTKPVVDAGVMPAHAQASNLTIFSLSIQPRFGLAKPGGADWEGTFSYSDPLGEVDMNSRLYSTLQPCGTVLDNGETLLAADASLLPGSDGFAGTIHMYIAINCTLNSYNNSLFVTLGAGSRTSNTISAPFPNI